MKPIQRIIVIVLDGVGAGEAPDAAEYGDVGSNSLGNTARVLGGSGSAQHARSWPGLYHPDHGRASGPRPNRCIRPFDAALAAKTLSRATGS